jgi:hypothetical protein
VPQLVLMPLAPKPASTGTSILPGAHGYLVLPDSLPLNCLLGGARVVFKSAFPMTHNNPRHVAFAVHASLLRIKRIYCVFAAMEHSLDCVQ